MPFLKSYRFDNATKDQIIADKGWIARNAFQRMRGLLGYDKLNQGQGLFLIPGNSIHMRGMKFPLDVIFVDKKMNVVKIVSNVEPEVRWKIWKMIFGGWKAYACFELPVGTIKRSKTEMGDVIRCRENNEEKCY